jgi:hypothetical protein
MLAVLRTLSFDVKTMSRLFCLVSFSFYDSLLGTTLGMISIVLLALAVRMFVPSRRQTVRIAAVYFCIFTFPVVSVKIMETFACHAVEGGSFLRADYALSCDDSWWSQWALYALAYGRFFLSLASRYS